MSVIDTSVICLAFTLVAVMFATASVALADLKQYLLSFIFGSMSAVFVLIMVASIAVEVQR